MFNCFVSDASWQRYWWFNAGALGVRFGAVSVRLYWNEYVFSVHMLCFDMENDTCARVQVCHGVNGCIAVGLEWCARQMCNCQIPYVHLVNRWTLESERLLLKFILTACGIYTHTNTLTPALCHPLSHLANELELHADEYGKTANIQPLCFASNLLHLNCVKFEAFGRRLMWARRNDDAGNDHKVLCDRTEKEIIGLFFGQHDIRTDVHDEKIPLIIVGVHFTKTMSDVSVQWPVGACVRRKYFGKLCLSNREKREKHSDKVQCRKRNEHWAHKVLVAGEKGAQRKVQHNLWVQTVKRISDRVKIKPNCTRRELTPRHWVNAAQQKMQPSTTSNKWFYTSVSFVSFHS